MLINEEMLAEYRRRSGELSLTTLPRGWFSNSAELFEAEWRLDDDGCPSAVTAVLSYTQNVPPLHAGLTWHALWHQSGGYTTSANFLIATPLTLRQEAKPLLDSLAARFYFAETGHFDHAQKIASLIVDYVGELKKAGLDCEATWKFLEEAIYPIDATQSNLDRLAIDAPKLSEITRWGEKVPRYIVDPAIFLLTSNSD